MKTHEAVHADPETAASASPAAESTTDTIATASADPVVADEVGHPVGVGIGALSAGAAGAAIGAVAGPIGMLVGAVVGAFAGGLVGEEVASSGANAVTDNPDASYTEPDLIRPTSLATGGSIGSTLGLASEPTEAPLSATGSLYSGSDQNVPSHDVDIPSQETAREDARISHLTDSLHDVAPSEVDGDRGSSREKTSALRVEAPAEESIRTGAYYHYVKREQEGLPGHHVDDWLLAERELKGS